MRFTPLRKEVTYGHGSTLALFFYLDLFTRVIPFQFLYPLDRTVKMMKKRPTGDKGEFILNVTGLSSLGYITYSYSGENAIRCLL